MSHPHNEHRAHKVEKSRVGHLTKGYKHGGAVKHSDEKQDRKLFHKMFDKEVHPEGHKGSHRMDRPKRAKGGKVGKGKHNARTIVNVITGGHPAGGAVPPMPMPAGPPPGLAGAAMPPPMAAKPPMPMPPPGAGPGMPPPGMPMRAKGGAVKSVGMNVGTKVQHTDGKDDGKDIGRGRVVTFWAGGKVKKDCGGPAQTPTRADGGSVFPGGRDDPNRAERPANQNLRDAANRGKRALGGRTESPQGVAAATRLPGGSGGGEARLTKEHRAERKG